jgi:hypothetical protein
LYFVPNSSSSVLAVEAEGAGVVEPPGFAEGVVGAELVDAVP